MGKTKWYTNRKKQNKIWMENHLKRYYKANHPNISPQDRHSTLYRSNSTCLKVSIPTTSFTFSFDMLKQQITSALLPSGWSIVNNSSESIIICFIESSTNPQIKLTFTISTNLTFNVSVYQHQIVEIPRKFIIKNVSNVINILNYLSELHLCPANNDAKYQPLMFKDNHFNDKQGKIDIVLLHVHSI